MFDKIIEVLAVWRNRLLALVLSVYGVIQVVDPKLIVNLVGKDKEAWVLAGIAVGGVLVRQYLAKHPAAQQETD